MRLTEGFITHETGGEQIMVSAGAVSFSGLVRSNRTAAFIVDQLKTETTKEQIVAAMAAKYDAPEDVIARDVEAVLEKLRSIGALTE
jgi:hypothetical protein